MIRVLNWRTRLIEWGLAQVGKKFKWGVTDCATLARRSLQECFGTDVAPSVPTYATRRRAARALKKHGSPKSILLRLGAEERPITFARAGDIILLPDEQEVIGGEAYGVWLDGACLLSGPDGVRLIPARDMPPESVAFSLWEIADEEVLRAK